MIIPFYVRDHRAKPRGPVVLILVIEKENLDRMKEGDPFDIQLSQVPMLDDLVRIGDVDLVVAYEEDQEKIVGFRDKGDLAGLIAWLERGRKIKPGDLVPPVRLGRRT